MEIAGIGIIKGMLLAGVFTLREPVGSIFSEETKEGVIEYLPDGSKVLIDNKEIYFSFLEYKDKIPQCVLNAWGY